MNFDDMRRRADAVRCIPLEDILVYRDAVRDQRDKKKWHTEAGGLSITGAKFMNWHQRVGGGGAIDLAMHLGAMNYREAVAWLESHFSNHAAVLSISPIVSSGEPRRLRALQLPAADQHKLEQVRRYLTDRRCLAASILDPLIAAGKIYADQRANAVFLMVAGKANKPIGAELRGTGRRRWCGMASGSRKDAGYFWVGAPDASNIVLCESAIDAISCFQLRRDYICISTAGVRAKSRWLTGLIARGYEIRCGFDADPAGDQSALEMMKNYPSIERLRPPAHDWNDHVRNHVPPDLHQ